MDYFEERDNVCMYEDVFKNEEKPSDIQTFFSGKSVFVTGATGLLGSLILEHILRKCPGLKKAYVLMRKKKGKSTEERLSFLLESELFGEIRKKDESILKKVEILEGDCSLPDCGLSQHDKDLLIEEVDVVYHSAAALSMDEHVKNAYFMNVRATKDLLDIGADMKNLKAFIYISTAYSFSMNSEIHEKFYDTPYTVEELKFLTSSLDDWQLGALTPKLLGEFQNVYSITKAATEGVIESYKDVLPVAVVRPSIVIGCHKEPLVGWINNVYGATGVALAAMTGILRAWYGGPDKTADMIPADKVVNAAIAVSWQIGTEFMKRRLLEVPVYNVVSSVKCPTTYQAYHTILYTSAKRDVILPVKFFRAYDFHVEPSKLKYKMIVYFRHFLPGLFFDQILKLRGKKPMLLKTFIKIYIFNSFLKFYSLNEWVFHQENLDKLWSQMSKYDQYLFNFDMTDFNWNDIFSLQIRAIILYILRGSLDRESLRIAYAKFMRFKRLQMLRNVFVLVGITWLLKDYICSLIN